MHSMISSYVASFLRRTVRSTTETSIVGTRKAMPVSLPLSSGSTEPTALAAPVEDGMMLVAACFFGIGMEGEERERESGRKKSLSFFPPGF